MKYKFLLPLLFLAGWQGAAAQSDYLAGTAAVSIEPDNAVFSLALAGYGAPRDGRFSIEWKPAGNSPRLISKVRRKGVPKVRDKSRELTRGLTAELISMANDGNQLYALCSDNTLWRCKRGASERAWVKIGCYNGLTYAIQAKHIAVISDRLYAVADDGKLYIAEHSSDGGLSVRALAVRKGDETAVIVSADLCGIDYSLASEVREIVFSKRGIPPAAVLINSSHTHFAPVMQKYPAFGQGQLPDSVYLNTVVKKGLVSCIEKALDNMSNAALHFGRGATNIGHNRTSPNRETPYDQALDVVKIEKANGDPGSLLFLAGCHPVFRNAGREGYTISANYPGVARQALEAATGAENTLFIQGCAGDINPRDDDHSVTGKELAGDVLEVLDKEMTRINGTISYSMDTILFPVEPWPEEKIRQFRKENQGKEGDIGAEKNVRWADLMLRYHSDGNMPAHLPVYVQTINIGNWKLIGLSREVVTEYGPAIRAIWPDKIVSVAGYCNDVSSYLPHDWHIRSRTYEGDGSFFWYGQPAIFPEEVLEIITGRIKAANK
ncbi:MAG TPA: hypothetical protein VD772_11700 [Anseongella sp.]|nr:hypothetical protein [Anseongella sp.]